MIVTIAILVLVVACLIVLRRVWTVANEVNFAIPRVLQLHTDALAAEAAAFTKASESCAEYFQHLNGNQRDRMSEITAAHGNALKAVADTHGQAANQLAAATAAHHAAAGSNADSAVELRRAASQLTALLADSNLLAIQQHLLAIKTFMLPR